MRARVPADCSVEVICYKGSRAVALPYDMPQLDAAKRALAEEWGREAVASARRIDSDRRRLQAHLGPRQPC